MIAIKNKSALAKMDKAGMLLSEILAGVKEFIRPGVSTLEIDTWIEKQMRACGLVARTKGYSGYKHASCISVNDAVIHGVPSKNIILKYRDLVKVDVIASWKGYCADMARTFFIEDDNNNSEDKEIKTFICVAQAALNKGIEKARVGNHLSDISFAIQHEVERHGYSVVRDFAGHGIGKFVHEEPEIPNYGKPGKGPMLRAGMVFAIEPMITMGSHEVSIMQDGWTVKTRDGSLAAHVEDTIVVTDREAKILTRRDFQSKGGKK